MLLQVSWPDEENCFFLLLWILSRSSSNLNTYYQDEGHLSDIDELMTCPTFSTCPFYLLMVDMLTSDHF